MSGILLAMMTMIIIIAIYFLYDVQITERLALPILKIRFQIIPDANMAHELYEKYIITIYDDMSSSRMIARGDGVILGTVNYVPNINRWWAAMRIINFPFEKVNPCPEGPTNYILEFGGKVISVGCAPMHVFNDLAVLGS
jgi:hypothetical protein